MLVEYILGWSLTTVTFAYTFATVSLDKPYCHYSKIDEDMNCFHVDIGELRNNVYPLNISTIKKLNLASTRLRSLENNSLSGLKNLTVLHLEHNKLNHLHFNLFTYTRKLKYLFLANNELTEIDNHLFDYLSELIYLDLSFNNIISFHQKNVFSSQRKLLYLRLNYNRLTYINNEVLIPLKLLKALYLDNNPFNCVCALNETVLWSKQKCLNTMATCSTPSNYNGKSWNVILKDENCSSFNINVSDCSYKCIFMNDLRKMDCSDLNLQYFSARNYPFNNTDFRKLWLNNNKLRTLSPDAFSLLHGLQYLSLRKNKIEILSPPIFSMLTELRVLHLSNNKLVHLDDELFSFQDKLQLLNLRENRLLSISAEVVRPLVSLKSLLMEGNWLICDCKLRLTYLWASNNNIYSEVSCRYPAVHHGRSWSLLNSRTYCDESSVTLILLTVLACLFMVFGISGLLCAWYFRKKYLTQLSENIHYNNNIVSRQEHAAYYNITVTEGVDGVSNNSYPNEHINEVRQSNSEISQT